MKIHKESKEGACVTEKVLVQYMTNKNRRRRRGRRRGCTEDHAKMLKSAGFELSDWALPLAALSLVALAVLVFFLVRLLRPLLSRMGKGKKESVQERMEGLRQAAAKVTAHCGEARAAAGPLLSTDYSAGDQMSRILGELAKAAELQEQLDSAVQELSERTGDHR